MVLIRTVSLLSCGGVSLTQSDVQHSTPLITFWPPGSPCSAFPSPRPSPSISTFYPRGAETQASSAPIQLGFLSPDAIAKAIGEPSCNAPDLLGGSEKPLGLRPLENRVLTTLLYVNRNRTIYCFSSTYEAISWKCDVTQRWQVMPDWYQVLRDP